MSWYDGIVEGITGAFSQDPKKPGWIGSAANWMENNKVATNLIGNTLAGIGGYFAQKQANKDLMRQQEAQYKNMLEYQKELFGLQDKMKEKYSAVPESDFGYGGLVVDDAPNLANGGILTEIKKRSVNKKGIV